MGITTKCGIGHATDSLLVQISIDPIHFPAGLLDHAKRAVGVAQSMRLSLPGISQASLLQQAVKLTSIATADKEAAGIVTIGQRDQASGDASFPETL